MTRRVRTNGHVGSRIKKKWGKLGAPHSAKRKAWLRKIGKKGRRKAKRTYKRRARRRRKQGPWELKP